MTKEAYIRAVARSLRLPRKLKKRIKNDLLSDFTARMEAGETLEQIMTEMGAPEEAAEEFRQSFADQLLPRRTAVDWALLAVAILSGASAAWNAVSTFLLPAFTKLQMHLSALGSSGSVAIIGGADGPTAIFVSGPVNLLGFLLPLLLCLACVGLYAWHRKRKKSA